MNQYLNLFLEKRGFTQTYLDQYFSKDTKFFKGTPELCALLKKCYGDGSKLIFVPDYDTDGIMSALVGRCFFESLGFNYVFLPSDPRLGYGLNKKLVDIILKDHSDAAYLITADLGINDLEQIKRLEDNGITVLVTDHHHADDLNFTASVVVNPMLDNEVYSSYSGSYTLWQTLRYFIKRYYPRDLKYHHLMDKLLIFASVGNISDTMPLLYSNKSSGNYFINHVSYFYNEGLRFDLSSEVPYVKKVFESFYTLLGHFKSKYLFGTEITVDLIGFYVAPLLNTIKRLSLDPNIVHSYFETGIGLEKLIKLNEMRKNLVDEIYTEVVAQGEKGELPYYPYVLELDILPGLCGLIAMKLMMRYQKPCVVLSGGSGSGRYPAFYEAYDLPAAEKYPNIRFRGHKLAFGASGDIKEWYRYLKELDELSHSEEKSVSEHYFDLEIDMSKNFDYHKLLEFVQTLDVYKPFGKGFEAPFFKFVVDSSVGQELRFGADEKHLKLKFGPFFEIIDFFSEGRKKIYYGKVELTDFGLRVIAA